MAGFTIDNIMFPFQREAGHQMIEGSNVWNDGRRMSRGRNKKQQAQDGCKPGNLPDPIPFHSLDSIHPDTAYPPYFEYIPFFTEPYKRPDAFHNRLSIATVDCKYCYLQKPMIIP
jgi:hypothetical protein